MALSALLVLLFFLSVPAWAVVIRATPDRNPVRMDETFNLVFSTDESVDDDPDFAPLEQDFEILGHNQGSRVSFINGKMSRSQEWTLTLSPKRAGAISIPAIAFGSDRSQPAQVTVLESGSAAAATDSGDEAEIKLEVEAEPRNPYVQAQVIYTVRVLLRVNLAGADLSEPVATDALIERLGDDHRYSASRGGREYAVIERKYAVFPQKSGLLRIDPLQLTAQIEVGGRSFFSRPTRAARVKSEAVDLKVRPIPPEFSGRHWLPATDLKLEETWSQDPPQAKAGEPLTRTLTLRARGATVGILPEMGADLRLDPSIKLYPDQPTLSEDKQPTGGISGMRQEKVALIPGQAGQFELPAVEIPWWNTKTDRMEVARIPARTLTVEPSAEMAKQVAPPAVTPAGPQVLAEPSPVPASVAAWAKAPSAENVWFWLALFSSVGWLGTSLAWWRSRRPNRPANSSRTESDSILDERASRKRLQQACASGDARAARTALLDWAAVRWPDALPVTLADIARLGGGDLAEEIEKLNRALYCKGEADWRGERLWSAVEFLGREREKKSQNKPELEPLYLK